MTATLPTDAAERKAVPMAEGLLYYFPNALAEVARVSRCGNDQHNPGQAMHWAMEKSTDHADCILRHLIDAGEFDKDGQRHTAKVAWRALALLEVELIAQGATPGRNAIRAPSPNHDPAGVAFRHGDSVDAQLDVARLRSHGIGDVPVKGTNIPKSGWTYTHLPDGSSHLCPTSAVELAAADGCAEYGNPVTPGCAPWRLP